MSPRSLIHVFLMAVILLAPHSSWAQKSARPHIIRDTEIENTLKEWLTPLLKAAGMEEKSVNLILVQSAELNAFVAGGSNIFIYTGLIDRTDNPGELIGVMAHELGHVAAAHLVSSRESITRASYESILGIILGIGTAIVSGNGGAASAIISGSGNIAQRRYLANSRIREASADQAALRYLSKAAINPTGLTSFFEKLGTSDLLSTSQQSEYVRTHPLTQNRIEYIREGSKNAAASKTPYPARWIEQHKRMKAKLTGFIDSGTVPWVYDDRDTSVAARYARAIAAYRTSKIEKALSGIETLITQEPQNPYFYELKGQMLFEFGRIEESLAPYKQAISLRPQAYLIRTALGHALLESAKKDPARLKEAIKQIERALSDDPHMSRAHRFLATAYGRLGLENIAKLHLAEEALLQRRLPYAKKQAKIVQKNAAENSREWLRAYDILRSIDNIEKKSKS